MKGGLTDIDALTPACPPHHRLIGDGPDQWQTIMLTEGPDQGRVAWIPPVGVDPERRPRVNRAHHANETVEAAWAKVMADRQSKLAQILSELTRGKTEATPDPEPEDLEPEGSELEGSEPAGYESEEHDD